MHSLILPVPVASNPEALHLQEQLMEEGYLVGAIRQPTVAKPILRIIPRLGASKKALKAMLKALEKLR